MPGEIDDNSAFVWLIWKLGGGGAVIVTGSLLILALWAASTGRERLVNKVMIEQVHHGLATLVIIASLVSVSWGTLTVLASFDLATGSRVSAVSVVRMAAWLCVVGWMMRAGGMGFSVVLAATSASVLMALAVVLPLGVPASTGLALTLAMTGLGWFAAMMVCNERDSFHALKWYALALGTLFLFEIVAIGGAVAGLWRPADAPQALINAAALCFLAVALARSPKWAPPVFISRQVVHAGILVASLLVIVLLWTALAALLLPQQSAWTNLLLLNAGALLLALCWIAQFSGSLRASVTDWIDRHFFANRYDYRQAWQQFLDGVDTGDRAPETDLATRLVHSVADTLGATGGALWLDAHSGPLVLAGSVNCGSTPATIVEPGGLPEDIRTGAALIEADPQGRIPGWPEQALLPAWLAIPLRLQGRLLGLVILALPRHRRPISAEDRELIRLMANQCASYLHHDRALRALMDVRAFESFNRRFAFVLHDVKNLSHELTLTLENARRHEGNAAFYQSLLRSLEKMDERARALIASVRRGTADDHRKTELDALISTVVDEYGRDDLVLRLESRPKCKVDALKLGAVLRHVIDNAIDASDSRSDVIIALREKDGHSEIIIEDHGEGMSREFVRDHLFRPFASTKAKGMGIGLVQARTIIEEMDGKITVRSAPGEGTSVSISLPGDPAVPCDLAVDDIGTVS